MRNKNILIFFYVSFYIFLFIYFSQITNYILNNVEKIELSNFKIENNIDSLQYRKIENHNTKEFIFTHKLYEEDFDKINSENNYYLIIYKLYCESYEILFNEKRIGMNDRISYSNTDFKIFTIERNSIQDENEVKIKVNVSIEFGLSEFPIIITNKHYSEFIRFILYDSNNTLISITLSFSIFVFMLLFIAYFFSDEKFRKKELLCFSFSSLFIFVYLLIENTILFNYIEFIYLKDFSIIFLFIFYFFITLGFYYKYNKLILKKLNLIIFFIFYILYLYLIRFNLFYDYLNYLNIFFIIYPIIWILVSIINISKSYNSKLLFFSIIILLFFNINSYYNSLLDTKKLFNYEIIGYSSVLLVFIIYLIDYFYLIQRINVFENKKLNILHDNLIKDNMTDIYNHEYINNVLSNIEEDFYLILLNINNFKRINDEYGHQFGDDVIRFISQTSKKIIDNNIIIGRYGGDEFIYILLNKSKKETIIFAELLKSSIEEKKLTQNNEKIDIKISLGISSSYKITNWKKVVSNTKIALKKAKEIEKSGINFFNS